MTELHILNGDFALAHWKKASLPGEGLVWRETYLEGPLPETEDLHTFRTARAAYLSTFAELSQVDVSRLYNHLKVLDESVLDLVESASVTLWFDSCIFDQTLLMRILYLFSRREKLPAQIFLYCCPGNCLTAEDFSKGTAEKRLLDSQDVYLAAKAWLAYQHRDGNAMVHLAQEGNFERMPAMQKALLRCAKELPDHEGLIQTQRNILQIVEQKPSSFIEIFKALDQFEELPFLGDTACQRLIDDLISKGLLKVTPEKIYSR